jgi:hypothetical protein
MADDVGALEALEQDDDTEALTSAKDTGDEVAEDEPGEDVLAPVLADLEQIWVDLEEATRYGGEPIALEVRATMVRKIAERLTALPARLHEEAGACKAEAAGLRAIADAEEAFSAAEEAVTVAAEAHEATAEPERIAAGRATEAKQAWERAADEAEQARTRGASPDVLIEVDMRVTSALRVAEHEAGKLGEAQAARQALKTALGKARDEALQAQETLTTARAAATESDTANLDQGVLLGIWALSWPWRLDGAAEGTQPKLSDDEYKVIRFLATNTCDTYGWVPGRAEAQVREQVHRELVKETAGRGRYTIDTGHGVVSLARVLPGEIVAGGAANQLATIAGGR